MKAWERIFEHLGFVDWNMTVYQSFKLQTKVFKIQCSLTHGADHNPAAV
jgi:hypothetical protein